MSPRRTSLAAIVTLLEGLTLQARLAFTSGNTQVASERLAQALDLAEPEGYVRVVVDEGAPMRALIQATCEGCVHPGYCKRLLAAFPE